MTASKKPEPIVVGVTGFLAEQPMGMTPPIDWNRVIELPKFQMFACERSHKSHEDVMSWIVAFVEELVGEFGNEHDAFAVYEAWHDEKDYWKNETIFGELK